MAWPIHNNTSITSTAYPFKCWCYADLGNCQIEHPKPHETRLMSPSPDPSTTARTSTLSPYNHHLQAPSIPIPPGNMLSPAPSSDYLDTSPVNRSIHHPSPRSVPAQTTAPVFSPASLCDVGPHSPWSDMAIPIEIEEPVQLEASKGPSQTKSPCRRRRGSRKSDDHKYGTYKCEWKGCQYDRMFSRKGVLMRHIETVHVSPRAFECPFCDHASSRRENLKAHMQSVHREGMLG